MNNQKFINPFIIFFLVFPVGISQGFVTVALPYLLTHQGFSVAETAGVIAIGFSANLWRFLWGPIVDISLSLKKWYWISLFACITTLILLCYASFGVKGGVATFNYRLCIASSCNIYIIARKWIYGALH